MTFENQFTQRIVNQLESVQDRLVALRDEARKLGERSETSSPIYLPNVEFGDGTSATFEGVLHRLVVTLDAKLTEMYGEEARRQTAKAKGKGA